MGTNIDLSETQSQLEWLKQKLYLNTLAASASQRFVKRGQVYRCNLGMGVGSEMQKDRPCVIVQNNIANHNSSNTIVVPITHGTASLPTIVPITPKYDSAGIMLLDGSANASNVSCVSKARLGNYVCDLTNSEMKSIDEAIAISFGIIHYYADVLNKYNRNVAYANTVKESRNNAEDKLLSVQDILDSDDTPELILEKLKKFFEKG